MPNENPNIHCIRTERTKHVVIDVSTGLISSFMGILVLLSVFTENKTNPEKLPARMTAVVGMAIASFFVGVIIGEFMQQVYKLGKSREEQQRLTGDQAGNLSQFGSFAEMTPEINASTSVTQQPSQGFDIA